MDKNQHKFDMQIVSIQPMDANDVKKSFASLADKEDLQLDPDLMYAKFIMCHEGANVNGDYFTKDVLIRAQSTPKNKPIDWEHGQPMIGTIIDSQYSEDANGIGYIEAIGVIWKFVYPELADAIKEKSATNELRLSMECYFQDANYMVGSQIFDSEQAEQLNVDDYVGRQYMGQPVYRVFKDVVFGGVGVVANPADKGAVFLAVAKAKKQIEEAINVKEGTELSDSQIRAIADIVLHPVNDFIDKIPDNGSVLSAMVAQLVGAFDDCKNRLVSRLNNDTLSTKEQVVSDVKGIFNELLAQIPVILDYYYTVDASSDDTNTTLNQEFVDVGVKDDKKGGKEDMTQKKKAEVIDEEVQNLLDEQNEEQDEMNQQCDDEQKSALEYLGTTRNDKAKAEDDLDSKTEMDHMTDETEADDEEVTAKKSNKKVQVKPNTDTEDMTDDMDNKKLKAHLEVALDQLKEEKEARASIEAKFEELKKQVEAKERVATASARLTELAELGVELSEARKAKEIKKISAMSNEAFNDYKEFLSELLGNKVEASAEEPDEEEIKVEKPKEAQGGLNIEIQDKKVVKPFSHLR